MDFFWIQLGSSSVFSILLFPHPLPSYELFHSFIHLLMIDCDHPEWLPWRRKPCCSMSHTTSKTKVQFVATSHTDKSFTGGETNQGVIQLVLCLSANHTPTLHPSCSHTENHWHYFCDPTLIIILIINTSGHYRWIASRAIIIIAMRHHN